MLWLQIAMKRKLFAFWLLFANQKMTAHKNKAFDICVCWSHRSWCDVWLASIDENMSYCIQPFVHIIKKCLSFELNLETPRTHFERDISNGTMGYAIIFQTVDQLSINVGYITQNKGFNFFGNICFLIWKKSLYNKSNFCGLSKNKPRWWKTFLAKQQFLQWVA